MKLARLLCTAAAAAALGGAFAPAWAEDVHASADIVRTTEDGHAFQNGGVSREQVAEMNHHMAPYDLRLTFSEGRHNDYAAGLDLKITDAAGRPVFTYGDAGPLTDIKLPAGHYRVDASFGGVARSGSVDVKPGERAFLYLHWPRDET